MIAHKDLYVRFIISRGVGSNDKVASSPDSYVSYLNGVARLIESDITPHTLRSEADISNITERIKGKRSENTIRHYQTAMRQYVAMVEAQDL